jgi:putative transcription factor
MEQDWDVVVLRKKGAKPSAEEAKRAGAPVVAEKRFGAGSNKTAQGGAVYARKLEEETDDFHLPSVSLEFKVALQQARQSKGWTQKDLAQRANEKPSVINDYESGRAVPNPQVVSKLQRVLGVSLPKLPKPAKKRAQDEE